MYPVSKTTAASAADVMLPPIAGRGAGEIVQPLAAAEDVNLYSGLQ